jgi:hypothetical protein
MKSTNCESPDIVFLSILSCSSSLSLNILIKAPLLSSFNIFFFGPNTEKYEYMLYILFQLYTNRKYKCIEETKEK